MKTEDIKSTISREKNYNVNNIEGKGDNLDDMKEKEMKANILDPILAIDIIEVGRI